MNPWLGMKMIKDINLKSISNMALSLVVNALILSSSREF